MNEVPRKPMRLSVMITAVAVVLAVAALGVYVRKAPRRITVAQPAPEPDANARAEAELAELREAANATPVSPSLGDTGAAPPVRASAAPQPDVKRPQATPAARDLITRLRELAQNGRAMTPEQAAAWRDALQHLVQQGAGGAAAIREFLEQNQDLNFTGIEDVLGHSSLRRAMFSALEQIGGPEAAGVALDILQQTASPSEIALLAHYLERQAPGEYRQQYLGAIRETLAMAASGKLQGWDVGPLFQVLQAYGDSAVAMELASQIPQWKFYSMLALAGMPSGEGVPALVRMAEDPSRGNRMFAWEMLAQVSTQYPDAGAALLNAARQNTIPSAAWPMIASALAGNYQQIRTEEFDRIPPEQRVSGVRTYHIASGNQNFYSVPQAPSWPPEYIQQRLVLINQVMAATSNPQAIQALQEQQRVLAGLLQR